MLEVALPKRFRLIRQLGEGGMGVVYEAHDDESGARVALKVLRNLTPESLARFKREFRAVADLNHPNIVALGELISEGAQWFFTMDLVEGCDFLEYVRPGTTRRAQATTGEPASPPVQSPQAIGNAATLVDTRSGDHGFDELRLRSSIPQLASALEALHAAGMVHRDVTPSNVRVTNTGRVVLLDFGLVADFASNRSATELQMVGTPGYMAPEQAVSGQVGPAADWYSVGVLVYEALTGALPFSGAPLDLMMQKQQDGAAPSALSPHVPRDLDSLCSRLLRFNPAARPTGDEVIRAVGATASSRPARPSSYPHAVPFVGRSPELEGLRAAFQASRRGAVTVLVSGESGVGKSCLVRHFVESLAVEEAKLVVLSGRCYEREAVPYKAFDGVIDALTRFLMHESVGLMPTRPGPLAQVFPVLRRVEAFAAASRKRVETLDPLETRSRAFTALREILTRLGDRRPLVIVIDDLQWADAESLALLAEVLRPPEPPSLLLIATTRGASALASEPADATDAAVVPLPDVAKAIPGDVRAITLVRLGHEEARDLAERLLRRVAPTVATSAEAIAREADGHPFFIDALVRHAAVSNGAVAGRLDDALWSSISSLDATARTMMELVAVAAAPLTQETLAIATGATPEAFAREVARLRVAHLLASTGARLIDKVEPYHDRVGAAVRAHLDAATRTRCHDALARALEHTGSKDAVALARHWRGAGEKEQAARYSVVAGDAAALTLAFDRAASLYKTALSIGTFEGEERRALEEKLGDAYANAGKARSAAKAYRRATTGAPTALALDLQRRAADQLLRGGHIDDGVAAIRSLLESIGIRLPRSPIVAALSLLVRRLWLRVRGLGFKSRDASQIAAEQLTHVDICWSVAFGLGMSDSLRGTAFQARNLLVALRAGEPYRVARAMSLEVMFLAGGGSRTWSRTEAAMKRAVQLSEATGNEQAIGWALAGAGTGYYLNGRFKLALESLRRALDVFRSHCTGVAWELDTVHFASANCLVQLGSMKELASEVPRTLRDAADRGDVFTMVNTKLGLTNLHWLAEDDPGEARAQVRDAMAQWPRTGFKLEHYYELRALTNVLLYEGNAADANAYIQERWGALRRSLLPWVIQSIRIIAANTRARAALAAAEARGTGGRGGDARLLGIASRHARVIERERMAWGTPQAKLVLAGVEATRRGSVERVVALLRESVAGFDAADMALHAAAARRQLGAVIGGDEGRGMVSAASEWMMGESVKNPERMTVMLAPGFGRFG